MKKLTSIAKKAINLNLKAYNEGKRNFKAGLLQKEAEERAKICLGCFNCEEEPIEELRVQDFSIPDISNKMCERCGCSIALKIRQNLQGCPLKKW